MNVLMTADTLGGVWTYSLELIEALAPHGVQVHLATKGRLLNDAQRNALLTLSNADLHESEFRCEWMDDPWADLERCSEWLLEIESALRPDVVHLNDYAHGAQPWAAPSLVVGHSCVMSWWEAVRGGEPDRSWDRYRAEVATGLGVCDVVVAPSWSMLDALERHYEFAGPRYVIPNARAPYRFYTAAKDQFVLTAGRVWDDAKNVAALETVAPRLSWPVLIAGEGFRYEEEVSPRSRVRRLGLLAPAVLGTYMARAPIFAAPARYEPFGLSVLEAALSRCALVLGDIPSLRENWQGAAIFVPPEDPEALQASLQQLIDDAPAREWMAEAAYRRALQFSPERMAESYAAIYRRLVAERRRESTCAL